MLQLTLNPAEIRGNVTTEPPHDKNNKMTVRPAKTQISQGIRLVWSESSLCTQWVAKDQSFLHADSEDTDQTGRMPGLTWVFAGRTVSLLVLSWGGSNVRSVLDGTLILNLIPRARDAWNAYPMCNCPQIRGPQIRRLKTLLHTDFRSCNCQCLKLQHMNFTIRILSLDPVSSGSTLFAILSTSFRRITLL